MHRLVLSLAAAGAALSIATPAAAQYYPQSYGYGANGSGYNDGYGYNAYGYGNDSQVRSLKERVDAIQYRIKMLDRRDAIDNRSADRLRDEAGRLESRLRRSGRYGLNPYEANELERRLARLESEVQYASAQSYGRYGRYGYDRHDGDDRDHERDWNQDRD